MTKISRYALLCVLLSLFVSSLCLAGPVVANRTAQDNPFNWVPMLAVGGLLGSIVGAIGKVAGGALGLVKKVAPVIPGVGSVIAGVAGAAQALIGGGSVQTSIPTAAAGSTPASTSTQYFGTVPAGTSTGSGFLDQKILGLPLLLWGVIGVGAFIFFKRRGR